MALVRLLGSGLVIAAVEEFFWRGFLYRFLIAPAFTRVDPGTFAAAAFLAVAAVFGLEHDRWLAGVLAGLAYGAVFVRTRDIWAAVVAHAATNLLLGLYVLSTGAYRFW